MGFLRVFASSFAAFRGIRMGLAASVKRAQKQQINSEHFR
jgi:hypothetical protein